MAWFKKASDADLMQSMNLAVDAAREARQKGDKKREAAFHEDLDNFIGEARRRGWKQDGPGWKRQG